jgi:CRP-like cAMP-binding protein
MSEVAKILVEESHDAGTVVFNEGDPAGHVYALEEGRIRLSFGDEGHIVYIVSNPGDTFGWSSLVDRDTYTASAECLTATKVIKLDSEALNRVFTRHPESGLMFFKSLAGMIGQRLINSYNVILSAQKGEGPPSYG